MRKYQKGSTPPQISLGFSSNKTGFTLIELLVVIAVLGVLAAGLITIINPAGQLAKARDAGRKFDLKQIANALEAYAAANGSYPSCLPSSCWAEDISVIAPTLISSGDLKKMPQDPNYTNYSPSNYYYRYNFRDGWDDACGMPIQQGKGYIIYAWLENSKDPDIAHYCGAVPYTETDGSGKVRGLYMYYSGKKVP